MSRCICLDANLFVCFNDCHRCICPKDRNLDSCRADIHNDHPEYKNYKKYLRLNKKVAECFCGPPNKLKFLICEYSSGHNCICEALTKNGLDTASCRGKLNPQTHFCICSYISNIHIQKCRATKTKHFTHTC